MQACGFAGKGRTDERRIQQYGVMDPGVELFEDSFGHHMGGDDLEAWGIQDGGDTP